MTLVPITLKGRDNARTRLKEAIKLMGKTAHLPPGNEEREEALRQYREAVAIASEWGLIPSTVEQLDRRRGKAKGTKLP